MSLVTELRRRQVFRAAAWYAAAAWVAIQVASTVIPQFGLPEWSVRAVIVAAVLGLPIALALAWFFDISALGLRREATIPAGPSTRAEAATTSAQTPLWQIPSFWIALALGVGLTISAQQAWQQFIRPTLGARPSLAVLPFANLSPDPGNAYFADGLHEEILATLARAGGLRVISRTSVQGYRDTDRNLREIADALDVSLILEGSVRREGEDMRLTLQLIDGRTDEHLWAETYDRKFRDALALQRTVAQQVVAAIGARLTPTEEHLIEQAAPTLPEAHDRYLHALALLREQKDALVAERLLSEVIALEPGFALAYALRARARLTLGGPDKEAVELREGARVDIEQALALQPDLPEALVARGLYRTWVSLVPEQGLADLERALAVAPNDADTQWAAAMNLRRLGRFDEALEHFEQAMLLSPGQPGYALEFAATLNRLGRLEEAEQAFATAIERYPAESELRLWRGFNQFLATGKTAAWKEEYDRLTSAKGVSQPDPFMAFVEYYLLTCTGDLAGLIELSERAAASAEGWFLPPDFVLGLAHTAADHPDRALRHLEATIADMEQDGDDALSLAGGAIALELLGRSAEAVRAADEAVRLLPETRDAVNGPEVALERAWVLIHSGIRSEEGYAELERLVGAFDQQPRWVAAQLPWVILRDDGRAQQIIRSKFPKT